MTTDDKYSLCNSENLQQTIQMLLSENQKTLSEFFTPSLKHPSHFDHFGQKDDSHNLSISEITDCKRRG